MNADGSVVDLDLKKGIQQRFLLQSIVFGYLFYRFVPQDRVEENAQLLTPVQCREYLYLMGTQPVFRISAGAGYQHRLLRLPDHDEGKKRRLYRTGKRAMIDIDNLRYNIGIIIGRCDEATAVFRQQAVGQVSDRQRIQTIVKSGRWCMAVKRVWH
jgi:hypothetical protein